ncbi:MAG: hypothetical protein DME42_06180, partial [Verrucomicrobia bacterium]
MSQRVIIVGLGEVGKPLLEIITKRHEVFGVDIDSAAPVDRCDVMHICFPFRGKEFTGQVSEYIRRYQPDLTIINSTVAPGTTRHIATGSGKPVVNSPVRGKHVRMQEEMLHYTKFVGALDMESGVRAADHFQSVGMRTKLLGSPE